MIGLILLCLITVIIVILLPVFNGIGSYKQQVQPMQLAEDSEPINDQIDSYNPDGDESKSTSRKESKVNRRIKFAPDVPHTVHRQVSRTTHDPDFDLDEFIHTEQMQDEQERIKELQHGNEENVNQKSLNRASNLA
jgi:hypothetical protein